MRLLFMVEGDVEYVVLKKLDFLQSYTTGFAQVRVENLKGNGNLKKRFKQDAEQELSSDPELHIFCLIDLHQAPFEPYPRSLNQDAEPHIQLYRYIQQFMRSKIDLRFRERFHAFPVIWEIETWLLADHATLVDYFHPSDPNRVLFTQPEEIQEPAKKLSELSGLFLNGNYDKVNHGQTLFSRADAQRIYADNCLHFKELINKLQELQGFSITPPAVPFAIPNQAIYDQLVTLEEQEQTILDALSDDNLELSDKKLLNIGEQKQLLLKQLRKPT